MLFTPPNRAAWAWGYRLVVRSSKVTADGFGPPQTTVLARLFNLPLIASEPVLRIFPAFPHPASTAATAISGGEADRGQAARVSSASFGARISADSAVVLE